MSKKERANAETRQHMNDVDRSKGGTFMFDKEGYLEGHIAATKDGVRAGDPLIAIKNAINQLDRNDVSKWTDQGVPRVDAIEELLGEEITKSQRDAAWAQVKE
jgi:hypothetical protein